MQPAGGNTQGEAMYMSTARAVRPRDEVLAREVAGAVNAGAGRVSGAWVSQQRKAEPAPLAVVMLQGVAEHPQETTLCLRKVSLLTFLVLNPSKEKCQIAISSFCIF